MIALTLRLVARSSAWIAPSLVLVLWIAITLGNRSTVLSAVAGLFYAMMIWSTWMTISTGNIDTDAHRDLLAAASGSASRLHAQRAATVAAASVFVGLVASTATIATGISSNRPRDFVVCALVTTSGGWLGVSYGTFLHRPVLRHRGLTVLIALLLIIVTIVSPATINALDEIQTGTLTPAMAVVIGMACWSGVVVAVASRLAATRAR